MAREGRLADHKASLDAKEQEISLREENLEATLRAKMKVWSLWCSNAPKN